MSAGREVRRRGPGDRACTPGGAFLGMAESPLPVFRGGRLVRPPVEVMKSHDQNDTAGRRDIVRVSTSRARRRGGRAEACCGARAGGYLPGPLVRGGGGRLPAGGFAEEVVDLHGLARRPGRAQDVQADGEVEDTEAEGREDDRPVVADGHLAAEELGEGAGDEVAVAVLLFGEVGGGVRLQAVLDVVEDVVGALDELRADVAQRDVEDDLAGCEGVRLGDVRLGGGGGEDDHVGAAEGGGEGGLGAGGVAEGVPRVGGERGAVLRVPVVDRDGTDLPVAGGEELQDVAGDDARADDGQPSGDAPAGEPFGGEYRGGGRAGGADLRGLQAGEGV